MGAAPRSLCKHNARIDGVGKDSLIMAKEDPASRSSTANGHCRRGRMLTAASELSELAELAV